MRTGSTAAGVIGGGLVGGLIGNLLDDRDRRLQAEAAQRAMSLPDAQKFPAFADAKTPVAQASFARSVFTGTGGIDTKAAELVTAKDGERWYVLSLTAIIETQEADVSLQLPG